MRMCGVAEEGWAEASDAGEPDAAGTDAEGFGGAVGSAGADPTHRDEAAMNGAPRMISGPPAGNGC